MSRPEEIFVPVPQEYMGIVIGPGGRNIHQIKRETDTRIASCNRDNYGKESGFIVTGTVIGCEKAQLAIRNRIGNLANFKKTVRHPEKIQTLKAMDCEKVTKGNLANFKKTVRHREKIQTLKTMDDEKLKKIGSPIKYFATEKAFSLGNGANGTAVYIGIMEDGSQVAVKMMLIQACEDAAENERNILSLIDAKKSPFIVSYRHFLKDSTFIYLIIDLCEDTLNGYVHSQSIEHLRDHGPKMIKEILTGLQFLHSHGILHRDLKPSNVLVDVEGHMKLSDFGISRVLNSDETTVQTDPKGTQGWMPVEVIESSTRGGKGRFKKKSDIQPAGMIAFFILTKGEHPFGSRYDRMTNILNGNPVNLGNLNDRDASQFISWLICHNVDNRPYADEALGHSFMGQVERKGWEDNEVKSVSPAASLSPTHSKVNDDVIKIDISVPNEYIGFVMGKGRKNIELIETKSGTKIKAPFRRNADAEGKNTTSLEITGPPKDCVRARWLIRHRVIAYKDKIANKHIRYGSGGKTQFVCFDFKDENENFELMPDGGAPKLDGFIQGPRYRIKSETDYDSQGEISDKTMTEIKKCLLTPLEILKKSEDEKHMIVDLWCHFGKVFVSGVDEEEAKKIMTPADISGRLIHTTSSSTLKNKDTNAYWKVSFEEGVDPLDDSALPNFGDENHDFLGLKLDHTQWRYDFDFITPSYRSVRLKAWEGLPADSDEKPPIEVKNILTPVALQAEEGIKAWICNPSITVLRGEIMIPNSEYDFRLNLRTGSRYVADEVKDGVCLEEDAILSKYLSKCKFDNASHSMDLPDEKDCQMPQDFVCMYYRKAEERIFSATVDGEHFTVTILDEKGWDSDGSDKRDQNQFGIKVAMDSWSEALLSPERNWTPEEILDKLKNYMDFLSLFKNRFLDG